MRTKNHRRSTPVDPWQRSKAYSTADGGTGASDAIRFDSIRFELSWDGIRWAGSLGLRLMLRFRFALPYVIFHILVGFDVWVVRYYSLI